MRNYEVIIVGAGPSGCAAAVQLSNLDPHLAERTPVARQSSVSASKALRGWP